MPNNVSEEEFFEALNSGAVGRKPPRKWAKPERKTKLKKGSDPEFGRDGYAAIDWDHVDNLMALQCTGIEIASMCGVDYVTLTREVKRIKGLDYADYYIQKSSKGRVSLRRKQYVKAVNEGNVQLLQFLGKNWLGQSDKVEHTSVDSKPLSLNYSLDEKPIDVEVIDAQAETS